MSTTPNVPDETPAALFPGSAAAPPRRHALGLPAGSVRAILALIVVGLLCVLILVSSRRGQPIPIPAYLLYLLFMIIGHFFAAHGVSISRTGMVQPPPLHLPRGSIRLLLMLMLGGTVGWKLYSDPEGLEAQLRATFDSFRDKDGQPVSPIILLMPVVLLAGFFLGVIVHLLVGRENTPYWFEDFEAWVALLAVLGLAIEAIIHLVINPTLETPLDAVGLQVFIAGFIAFYFGARS
jgi:hypothetical protein